MIEVIEQVGDVVLQKVVHNNTGEVVRYQYGKPGDAASIIHVQSLEEGRKAIAIPVYTIADRKGDAVIRRVLKGGEKSYEFSLDGVEFTRAASFAAARKAIGKVK